MKKITVFVLSVLVTFVSKAQDLEEILFASKEDANKITEAYINPAMKGLIYGMNSGWYHTAKVHKKFGFDISIGLNASIAPSEDEIITFANLGLSNNISFSSPTSPTVIGSGDGADASITQTYQGVALTTPSLVTLPSGISDDLPLNAIPTPALQLSVGLPYKFDVMLRLVPEVGSDDVKGNLFGIGLKKEITSIFGPLDKLPLHVSVLAAYSSMAVDYEIGNTLPGENQSAEFDLNSYTVQAIGSINFPIINFYAGLGYTGGKSSLKMLGEYEIEYNSITEVINDPIDLNFNASGFRATIGTRLSLGFFKIFGDYTLQEYNTLSAGIAFSFR